MEVAHMAGVAIVNQALDAIADGAEVNLVVRGIQTEVPAATLVLDRLEHTVLVTGRRPAVPMVLACHAIIGARFGRNRAEPQRD